VHSEPVQKLLMILVAVMYLIFAVWGLAAPANLAQFLGFQLESPDGFNEIRANYGGVFAALTGLFAVAAFRPHLRPGAWLVLALLMGGLASGRLISIVLDGTPGVVHLGAMASEIGLCALSIVAYRGQIKFQRNSSGAT